MEKKILLDWLSDVHSMELGLVQILKKHKENASDHLQIAEAIGDHIDETRCHAEKVRAEIERLGGDVSALKAWRAEAFGWLRGAMSGLDEDRLVKDALSENASEYLELVTYKAIMRAAEIEGDNRVREVVGEILDQKIITGEKLNRRLDDVIEIYYHDCANEDEEI